MPSRTPSMPADNPPAWSSNPFDRWSTGGATAAKATLGEPIRVEADVFTDGHDIAVAAVCWRTVDADGVAGAWQEAPMTALGNDRFAAAITAPELGRLELDVLGWIDHLETWRRNTLAKITAGLDVELELVDRCRRCWTTHFGRRRSPTPTEAGSWRCGSDSSGRRHTARGRHMGRSLLADIAARRRLLDSTHPSRSMSTPCTVHSVPGTSSSLVRR